MTDIEIPYVKDRGKRYRLFEILPGALSWSIIILPFALSIFNVRIKVGAVEDPLPVAGIFIVAYMLMWFVKSIALNIRALEGYRMLKLHQKLPWDTLVNELQTGKVSQPDRHIPSWHYETVRRLQETPAVVQPDDIVHAIIVATYNEAREIVEPTFQSVLASKYDMKKVIMVLAYEERGGPDVEKQSNELIAQYKDKFMHAMAVKHPKDIPGEVIGKGGNITYAGRELAKYLEAQKIDPLRVPVTTLDADNKPHPQYLAALSYLYAASPDPLHVSYQPIPMYTNNIWDVPAPMRVIATGNTFWNVVLSLRPHMIRNFASHAQSMAALIETDYWSVRTIVEDGHQFWRTYFRYDGKHEVYPIYLPIYQDAVLSNTLLKTLRAQFIQLRRWAWGASDIAYVIEKGYFKNNKVPKLDLTLKTLRLIEGHVSWATAPLILAFSAFIPLLFNPQDYAANQLPIIASNIQRIALAGIFVTLFLSLKLLPPKPARYKHHRTVFMVLQWVLLPVTTILYNSLSAVNSQTRLMFGRYLGKFDVTEKAFVTEDKQKKT
jgi:cellulose synthase/poly-beta-1,6-N-acetylglucosamine synthase-like glycosyltransferase